MSLINNGIEKVARVERAEDAKLQYGVAVSLDQSAALVEWRNSKDFSIDVNIEGGESTELVLTYEQQLEMENGKYTQLTNLNPNQVVDEFHIKVLINASDIFLRNIINVV